MASDTLRAAGRLANAFGRGYEAVMSPFDTPGADIPVSPVGPGPVETGTVTLKALTALMAGRRGAANAQLKREQLALDRQHRNLQIAKLQQDVAPVSRRPMKVYGTEETVMASDPDLIQHPGTFRAPTTGQETRVTVDPDLVQGADKLQGFDPATSTAPSSVVSQAEKARAAGVSASHWDEMIKLRREAADRAKSKHTAGTAVVADKVSKEQLARLDKEAEQIADKNALRYEEQAANAQRVLIHPSISPQKKAEFASMLGLRPTQTLDPQNPNKTIEVKGPDGFPIYSMDDVPAAMKAFVARKRQFALDQARAQQAAERTYWSQQSQEAGGYLRGEKPAPDANDEKFDAMMRGFDMMEGMFIPGAGVVDSAYINRDSRAR